MTLMEISLVDSSRAPRCGAGYPYFFSISSTHSGLVALVGILHSASVSAWLIGFDVCPAPGIEAPLGGVTVGAAVDGLPPIGRAGVLGAAVGEVPEDGSAGTVGAAIGGLLSVGSLGTLGICAIAASVNTIIGQAISTDFIDASLWLVRVLHPSRMNPPFSPIPH